MSGGSNNATIAIPGADWQMMWTYSFDDFQLDIVGFLAVLGEGSILSIAQVSALSRLFYLPRLLPAPQALLRPSRPRALQPTDASVNAVHSGNFKDHLHHVAHVLLDEAMPAFTVRCVKITKKRTERMLRSPTLVDRVLRGQPSAKKGSGLQEKTQTIPPPEYGSPPVKARATGPLSWVTLLGFFLSASLLIISITLGDGMSLIATLLLSGLSTLIGISNKWELQLPRRPPSTAVPTPGDVVIRYPNGSFLIVKCDEEIARELYFAPEEIVYSIQNETIYRMISLVGTLMLMLGVIFLANAKLQLQFCWGAAYIILNAAHWVAAALPQRLHWDLSCYVLEEQGVEGGPNNTAFTDALFKAILFTGSKDWVRIGKNAAPATETWDRWLREAEFEAQLMQRRCKQKERIKDQLWPKRDANAYGTVWEMPDPKIWNPRDAWQKLDKELKGDKGGTVSATQPVPAHTV